MTHYHRLAYESKKSSFHRKAEKNLKKYGLEPDIEDNDCYFELEKIEIEPWVTLRYEGRSILRPSYKDMQYVAMANIKLKNPDLLYSGSMRGYLETLKENGNLNPCLMDIVSDKTRRTNK